MRVPDVPEPLALLEDRIDLRAIPFTERGSRLLVGRGAGGLRVSLAERWPRRDGVDAVSTRPELLSELRVADGDGRPRGAEFTSYPHALFGGDVRITFVDEATLLLALPAGGSRVAFRAPLERARFDARGGLLELRGEVPYRLTLTANVPVAARATDDGGVELELGEAANGALLLRLAERSASERPPSERRVPDPRAALERSARRWQTWLRAVPAVTGDHRSQYYFAWWVMLAGLLSPRGHLTREGMTPSKSGMVGVWHWDAFFHALAYRRFDGRLAQDQLRILLDHQHDDGYLPDSLHDWEVVTRSTFSDEPMTKPPLFAWAAWKLYEVDGDERFLSEIYEPAARWNRWWFARNDRDGNGLCEYHHPYSSGLDNSPLWDAGMPVESPDLTSYLILHMDALARIARTLGREREAAAWAERAAALTRRLVELRWNAERGLFDAVGPDGSPLAVRTLFNLFPLVTGRLPPAVARRLVAQLTDPAAFWPRFPAPTVALDDAAFDPLDMWRGPTWMPTNYLLAEGLSRHGYRGVARTLRRRSLELTSRHADFYEYYHPRTGEAPPKAFPFMGWSAALFIEFALQELREQRGDEPPNDLPQDLAREERA